MYGFMPKPAWVNSEAEMLKVNFKLTLECNLRQLWLLLGLLF